MIGRMANGHQWFVMCAALLSGIVSPSADTLDLRHSRNCQPARGAFLPLYDNVSNLFNSAEQSYTLVQSSPAWY
jgi:hypothetical protein